MTLSYTPCMHSTRRLNNSLGILRRSADIHSRTRCGWSDRSRPEEPIELFLRDDHAHCCFELIGIVELGGDLEWESEGDGWGEEVCSRGVVGEGELEGVSARYETGVEGWNEGFGFWECDGDDQ